MNDTKIYSSNKDDIKATDGMLWTRNSGAQLDAFGRLRICQPYTLLDTKLIRDALPLVFDDRQTSGSGTTSAHVANKSAVKMSVSASTAGSRVRQSKMRGNYQPGKSQLVALTAIFGAGQTGITKRVGYFDSNNGLFFQLSGNTFSVVIRSYTSGAVVDTVITQANFNTDKLDGLGTSKVNINLAKSQRFFVDFEWLGVGDIRFGVIIDNTPIVCHIIRNTNTLGTDAIVYMTTPNLPIRYEIENDGTGQASDLYAICSTIMSEGGQEQTAMNNYISRNGSSIALANQDLYTPIISIRLKSSANSGTAADVQGFCTRITITDIDIIATTNISYEWRLYLNPTIAGVDAVNWVNITNSSLQYDVSRTNVNTVSDGYIMAGGYGSSTATQKVAVQGIVNSFLSLGSNIDFTTDQIVLAIANIDGNGGTVYGGISVREYC